MARTLLLILALAALILLALDAAGLLPLGVLGAGGAQESGPGGLLESEGEGGAAATLEGLGAKGASLPGEDDLLGAGPIEPEMLAEVSGSTPGGGVVRGRVVQGQGGIPVAGARVQLTRFDSLISYLRADVNGRYDTLEARTGADGRFAFLSVTPADDYVVRARLEGSGLAIRSQGDLDLGGRETLDVGDLVLGPGAAVSGRVLDHDAAPVADALVLGTWRITNMLGIVLSDITTAPDAQVTVRTGPDGRFAIQGLEPGATTLIVNAPSGAAAVLPSLALEEGKTKDVGDITLPGTHFLAGTVAWSDGSPVVGARVFAASMGRGAVRPTETAADGSFRIDWLPDEPGFGLGVLVAGMPVHMEQGIAVDRDDVRVEFPVPGRLEGMVVRAVSGAPVPRFRIQLDDTKPIEDWMERMVAMQVRRGLGPTPFTAQDGRFVFPRVAPGTYRLTLSADGFPDVKPEGVVVVARETTELRIEVPEGNIGRGVVQRSGGDPVDHARLYVIHGGVKEGTTAVQLGSYIRDREPAAVTRSDGRFELPPLTPGRYDLIAAHAEALPGLLRGVDLRAGDVGDLLVRLPPSGRVRGRVLDESARPAAREPVYVLYRNGVVRVEETGEDGRFEFGGMPIGRCLVRRLSLRDFGAYGRLIQGGDEAAREGAYDELRLKGEEHEIVDGGVAEVMLRIPPRTKVTGRLRVPGEGAELGGGFYVTVKGGGHWVHVETDEEGRYETRLLPGSYQAFIPVGERGFEAVPFVVPDAATHVIDLGS